MRERLNYSNVMATIAVFIALGGASYAAVKLPKNSVGTKQLRKNAVNGAKVKPNSLKGSDIRESTLGAVPTAEKAGSAASAQTLGGLSATQISGAAELRCPAGTEMAAGVCLESEARGKDSLLDALVTCADDDRRLPSPSELIAFLRQKFAENFEYEWTETFYYDDAAPVGVVISADAESVSTTHEAQTSKFAYRCVVPASN